MPAEIACPICSDDLAGRPDLRTHLMVEHRKSELARALTAGVAERRDDPLTT